MKKFYSVLFVFSMLLTSLGCKDDVAKSTLTKPGDKVPYFQIETIAGEKLDTNLLQGKIVLLNFFATWCPLCQEELPYLQKLSEQYAGQNIQLISIGREHSNKEIQDYMGRNGLTYDFAADPQRTIYKNFATQYIPRIYLIDENGFIVKQMVGFKPDEFKEITNKINELLNIKPHKL